MHEIARFQLWDRRSRENGLPRGLSCDEQGIFLAGEMPFTRRGADARGRTSYVPRHFSEINFALSRGYGFRIDFSDRAELLRLAAEAMTAGDWTRATLATVHLKLPDLPDQAAVERLQKAVAVLKYEAAGCSGARCRRCTPIIHRRDVSDEPRIPIGSPGGGRWTTDGTTGGGTSRRPPSRLLHPVQAVPIPFPGTIPLPLTPRLLPPIPLTPIIPYPEGYFPTNPYPERAECMEEWEYAQRQCTSLETQGKLGRRSGFGKSLARCLLGMVSEECGGNPTGDDDAEGRLIA